MEQLKNSKTRSIDFKSFVPVLALLGAVFFWGGSFVGMRIALKSLDPLIVIWFRMIIALSLILPFSGKILPYNYRKGDWKLLVPMVLLQPCLYFLLESNALRFTTSTQAGVISALVPVIVTFGAWMFLSESVNKLTFLGLIISVAGVIFLTVSQSAESLAENPVFGNILEALAMVFAASNMIIIKKLSARYNPWTLTAMQLLAGTIFFLPGLFKVIHLDSSIWTIDLVFILIYLGAFVSLGAFGLYNWGMSHTPASKASSYINLVPITAIFAGWIILGESLNLFQSISAFIVIIGVILTQRSHKYLQKYAKIQKLFIFWK